MTKYLRIKSGEANFQLVERFDEVEKAANPNAQGEVVECKVENIKLDISESVSYTFGSFPPRGDLIVVEHRVVNLFSNVHCCLGTAQPPL